MTYFRFALLPLMWFFASPAFAGADQPLRVVELFTSQGCSSCPPANEFVGQVADLEDTLVLSYGVTYWDYLGWKDTFAAPEFTQRQKIYARAFGSADVYTPQIVLNGAAHSSRYSGQDVKSMTLPPIHSKFSLNNDDGILNAKTDTDKPHDVMAVLVEYVSGPQSVPVTAGENHGRVLTLTNVVTGVKLLGRWSGNTLDTKTKPASGKSYALLLHDRETMKLVSALRYSD